MKNIIRLFILVPGICGIKLDVSKAVNNNGALSFITYQSFSTSLEVAREFAGNEGLIIAIKLNRNKQNIHEFLFCCDMSWISKFVSEKEILLRRNSAVPLHISNIYNIGNYQYIICSDDPLDDIISFEEAFLRK